MTNSETKNFSQNVSSSYHLEDRDKCNKNTCANTCNVPKLRFKGYNDEWVEKRIEKVLKIKHGKDQKAIENNDGIYPILATSGEIGRSNTFLWDKPCVLIGRKGTINKPQYMDTPFWTVDTLFYSYVFQNNNAKYLYYLFNTINWKKYDESTGVPSLSAKTIERIKIKISNNLREQEKIASFLTLIDKKIEKQKELVELLKKYKRGLLSAIFSQKLKFKDDNGNDYPAWEEKRLGDICKIVGGGEVTGNISYGLNAASKDYDGENKYIRITDIDETTGKFNNLDIVSPDCVLSDDYKLKINDLLFARTGASTGKTYLYNENDGKMYFAGFLIKFSIKNEYCSNFIFYITQTFNYKKWVSIMSARSGQPGINAKEYSNYKFSCPVYDEQVKISNIISKLDNIIEKENILLDSYNDYKKGLLQKLFI